jgi:hypothetical protein
MEGELGALTDIESPADFFESTLAGLRLARLPLLNHRSCEVAQRLSIARRRIALKIRSDLKRNGRDQILNGGFRLDVSTTPLRV